jgi:hypothetical protein
MEETAPVHPQHALAVYAEALAVGARVAVFGDSSLGLGARLARLGARGVQVWDPDAERARGAAASAPRGVSVSAYLERDPSDPPVDLALVADLGLFEDAAELIARVRRMVGEHGAAIVAAANRDVAPADGTPALDYYELFDVVAREFDSVRMVAQLSFDGVALVELGGEDDSPPVTVDAQLAESDRAPESFVVVASQRDLRLAPYAIIELPRPVAGSVAAATLAELQEQLHERSTRIAEVHTSLAERARQLAALSQEAEALRSAAEAGRIAAAEVEAFAQRADRAERRVATLEQELALLTETQTAELAPFEESLRERARAVHLLELELARRDEMVRELVGAVEDAAREAPATADGSEAQALAEENARLQGRLDALALELARREGEAQASVWSISELERRVSQASAALPLQAGPGPDRGAVLTELDALRKALTQEHEARLRAEGGDELARARAEIDRQAVLLDQLARELESRDRASERVERAE